MTNGLDKRERTASSRYLLINSIQLDVVALIENDISVRRPIFVSNICPRCFFAEREVECADLGRGSYIVRISWLERLGRKRHK